MGYDTYPITRLGKPDFNRDKKITHPLAPQQPLHIDCFLKFEDKHIAIKEQKHVDDLKSGDAAIYVVGEIRYDDAFGINRITTYKFFTGGPIGFCHSGMTAYEDGNDYT